MTAVIKLLTSNDISYIINLSNNNLEVVEMKKALKVIGIIIAVAGAAVGIYFAVKKYLDKKNQAADCEENYVSCSCCEAQ